MAPLVRVQDSRLIDTSVLSTVACQTWAPRTVARSAGGAWRFQAPAQRPLDGGDGAAITEAAAASDAIAGAATSSERTMGDNVQTRRLFGKPHAGQRCVAERDDPGLDRISSDANRRLADSLLADEATGLQVDER